MKCQFIFMCPEVRQLIFLIFKQIQAVIDGRMIWGQRKISSVGVFKENILCMRSGMEEAVKIVLREMCSF